MWKDYVFGLGRLQLAPSQVSGIEFLYDLLGIEHSAFERPADSRTMVYLPGRLDPQSASVLNPEVRSAFEHIIQFHNECKWTLPRLDAENIVEFMRHYDWYLRRYDASYQENVAKYA